jgi:hypothetical protein
MVELSRLAGAVWVMLDDDRPIGRVVAPAGLPALGPGGDTVLLRRTLLVSGEAPVADGGERSPASGVMPGPSVGLRVRRHGGSDARQERHPAAA